MGLDYALLADAWNTGPPPPMRVFDNSAMFDSEPRNDDDQAIEASPSPELRDKGSYDRLIGTRTTSTLRHHAPSTSRAVDASTLYSERQDMAPRAEVSASDDRGALYDVILFILAGCLAVLVFEQFVTIGQSLAEMQFRVRDSLVASSRTADLPAVPTPQPSSLSPWMQR